MATVTRMRNAALVIGANGQDGSYLCELLLAEGYDVTGTVRRAEAEHDPRLAHLGHRISLHLLDITDAQGTRDVVDAVRPDVVFVLAGDARVRTAWRDPALTFATHTVGATNMLDAVLRSCPEAHVWLASSSEAFGNPERAPQNEETPFHPENPYGLARATTHEVARMYRAVHGLRISIGIMYPHESIRRHTDFLFRRITSAVAEIVDGQGRDLPIGDLSAVREWGHARDHMRAALLMASASSSHDFVIATGETFSVQQVCEAAFERVGLDWTRYVRPDQRFEPSAKNAVLTGSSDALTRTLGWRPETSFDKLVAASVDAERQLRRSGALPVDA
jgi:GDPmannose 4,6-dehydratase